MRIVLVLIAISIVAVIVVYLLTRYGNGAENMMNNLLGNLNNLI